MKSIKYLLILAFIGFGLSSCDTQQFMAYQQPIMRVQKGMSQEQIIQILGSPTHRRFAENMEEWGYDKWYGKIIVVRFIDNRVESMDSFSDRYSGGYSGVSQNSESYSTTQRPPIRKYDVREKDDDFQQLYDMVKNQSFKDDKLKTLRDVVYNKGFTCRQCVRFMSIFSFDDEKLSAFYIVAPHIVDWENKDVVLNAFNFISTREKAQKTIEELIR